MEKTYANLKIVENPIVNQSLCTIRSKHTDTQGVRLAARKLTRILLYEATKNLPQTEEEVETPIASFKAKTINHDITIIISYIISLCKVSLCNEIYNFFLVMQVNLHFAYKL